MISAVYHTKKPMKKRFLSAAVAALMTVMSFSAASYAEGEEEDKIYLSLNGEYIESDADPFILDDRTMVPVRVISESLGYDVEWNGEERSVNISADDKKLKLFIDDTKIIEDGEEGETDVAPTISQDRTFVPVRIIAESFGCMVDWQYGTVEITKLKDVVVTNGEEFLNSIDNYTRIHISGEDFNLSKVENVDNEYVYEQEVFDGTEFIIDGVSNLEIVTDNEGDTLICVEPRYANVLNLYNCDNVTIEGITMGHTIEQGYCTGGVINLYGSSNISIYSCDLYGCGTYGVISDYSENIYVYNTEIRDCSYGCVDMVRSDVIAFEYCSFHDCVGFNMFGFANCSNVGVFDSEIHHNVSEYESNLVEADMATDVIFSGCKMYKNEFNTLCDPEADVMFLYCDIDSAVG